MKFLSRFAVVMFCTISSVGLWAQPRVGINTSSPERNLEVRGPGIQNINIVTATGFTGGAGIELMTGDNFSIDTDWRILSETGGLKFFTGDYNANFYNVERMRFNGNGDWGIGTTAPAARLHIKGGSVAGDVNGGYLTLGNINSYNLAFDNTQLKARNNGAHSTLYIQPSGGNTYVGTNGGNVYLANAYTDNRVGIGTVVPDARVGVADNSWQLYLRNDADDANDWYIGASGSGWGVGADQLVFAPSGNSSSAIFRLMNVTENDGTNAPVIIQSSASQRLLLDGNEIQTTYGPLYFNHNSENDTYFNVNGGNVGIGLTSPAARLHVAGSGSISPMALERGNWTWDLYTAANFYWNANGWALAHIDGVSGAWVAASDERMKTNIRSCNGVLDRVRSVNIYRYTFRNDPEERKYIGVIAQELQEQFPEMVHESQGQLGVAYGPLAVVVVEAIREQQELIADLTARIEQLRHVLKQQNPMN